MPFSCVRPQWGAHLSWQIWARTESEARSGRQRLQQEWLSKSCFRDAQKCQFKHYQTNPASSLVGWGNSLCADQGQPRKYVFCWDFDARQSQSPDVAKSGNSPEYIHLTSHTSGQQAEFAVRHPACRSFLLKRCRRPLQPVLDPEVGLHISFSRCIPQCPLHSPALW